VVGARNDYPRRFQNSFCFQKTFERNIGLSQNIGTSSLFNGFVVGYTECHGRRYLTAQYHVTFNLPVKVNAK
jgi:hypothetical protein